MNENQRREKILAAYELFPYGETISKLRDAAGLNKSYFDTIQAELIRERIVIECSVKKSKSTYAGFRLNPDFDTQTLRQLGQNDHLSELSDHADNHTQTASLPFRGEAERLSISARPSESRPKPSKPRALSDDEVDRVDDLFSTQSA